MGVSNCWTQTLFYIFFPVILQSPNFLIKNLFASIISEIELLGYKNLSTQEEKQVQNFISNLRIIYIDEAIKNKAIIFRRNYGLKLPDCLIAATVISLNLTLISSDKQFKQIVDLSLALDET